MEGLVKRSEVHEITIKLSDQERTELIDGLSKLLEQRPSASARHTYKSFLGILGLIVPEGQ